LQISGGNQGRDLAIVDAIAVQMILKLAGLPKYRGGEGETDNSGANRLTDCLWFGKRSLITKFADIKPVNSVR